MTSGTRHRRTGGRDRSRLRSPTRLPQWPNSQQSRRAMPAAPSARGRAVRSAAQVDAVTLVLRPLWPPGWPSQMVDFVESLANSELLSWRGRLLHRCYNQDTGLVTGLWYVPGTLVLGAAESNFVAERGHQQDPEGQYEKSVVHFRVPPGQVL